MAASSGSIAINTNH